MEESLALDWGFWASIACCNIRLPFNTNDDMYFGIWNHNYFEALLLNSGLLCSQPTAASGKAHHHSF